MADPIIQPVGVHTGMTSIQSNRFDRVDGRGSPVGQNNELVDEIKIVAEGGENIHDTLEKIFKEVSKSDVADRKDLKALLKEFHDAANASAKSQTGTQKIFTNIFNTIKGWGKSFNEGLREPYTPVQRARHHHPITRQILRSAGEIFTLQYAINQVKKEWKLYSNMAGAGIGPGGGPFDVLVGLIPTIMGSGTNLLEAQKHLEKTISDGLIPALALTQGGLADLGAETMKANDIISKQVDFLSRMDFRQMGFNTEAIVQTLARQGISAKKTDLIVTDMAVRQYKTLEHISANTGITVEKLSESVRAQQRQFSGLVTMGAMDPKQHENITTLAGILENMGQDGKIAAANLNEAASYGKASAVYMNDMSKRQGMMASQIPHAMVDVIERAKTGTAEDLLDFYLKRFPKFGQGEPNADIYVFGKELPVLQSSIEALRQENLKRKAEEKGYSFKALVNRFDKYLHGGGVPGYIYDTLKGVGGIVGTILELNHGAAILTTSMGLLTAAVWANTAAHGGAGFWKSMGMFIASPFRAIGGLLGKVGGFLKGIFGIGTPPKDIIDKIAKEKTSSGSVPTVTSQAKRITSTTSSLAKEAAEIGGGTVAAKTGGGFFSRMLAKIGLGRLAGGALLGGATIATGGSIWAVIGTIAAGMLVSELVGRGIGAAWDYFTQPTTTTAATPAGTGGFTGFSTTQWATIQANHTETIAMMTSQLTELTRIRVASEKVVRNPIDPSKSPQISEPRIDQGITVPPIH